MDRWCSRAIASSWLMGSDCNSLPLSMILKTSRAVMHTGSTMWTIPETSPLEKTAHTLVVAY